jgi:hypothetical protein
VTHDRLEIILHQPLLYQGALRERAPDFFRGMRHFSFNDHGLLGGIGHWSILFNKDSRRSNRSRQKAP